MLNQRDIDLIMQDIQSGKDVYIYYVAHHVELREGLLDEHIRKSVSQFKPVKVKITGIKNAYFEYLNFLNNPENYHTESEEVYYDPVTKYIHYYTVPNGKESYSKDLNSRLPSAIYGYRRQIIVDGNTAKEHIDPSPVKEVYTNALEYGDLVGTDITNAFNNGKLDWKYMKLDNMAIVDGIEYKYITSDWYILEIENFPRPEMPLVNIDQHCAYFRDLADAFYDIDQLVA